MFLILLICTVVSRSIETLLMPQVSIAEPKSGSLTEEIKFNAQFKNNYSENYENVIALSNWKISNTAVKSGDYVNKGDVLFSLDMSDFNIQLKQLEASVQQQKNLINSGAFTSGDLLVENSKLQALELSIIQLRNKYPINGKVTAGADGIINILNNNRVITEGTVIANINKAQDKSFVFISVTPEQAIQYFSQNKDVSVEFLSVENPELSKGKMETLNVTDESFVFDEQTGLYELIVSVNKAGIASGTPCVITVTYKSKTYKTLVPLNCVVNEADKSYVYAVKKRDGVFNQEYYVEKIAVQQENANYIYAALNNELDTVTQLAIYPTRTLRDGETVRVVD